MLKNRISIIALAASLFALTLIMSWTHPWATYPLSSTPSTYQLSVDPNLSVDGIVFYGMPDLSKLSDSELLIICDADDGPDGQPHESWSNYIYEYVLYCYDKLGYIPSTLTPEVLSKAYGYQLEKESNDFLEIIKSPITGNYPKLNEATNSPGNLYVKVLTERQKLQIALKSEYYLNEWYNTIGYYVYPDGSTAIAQYDVSPVFYWVIYGENSVIMSTLKYQKKVKDILYKSK